MSAPSYTFGSGEEAAERLLVLADVFEPTMAAILDELPPRSWPIVVDLGCGPGSTTVGLRRHLDADRVIGLEASRSFVHQARARVPDAEFVVGDVLADPWPLPPADLVYTRFLLSHLPDPVGALCHWQRGLRPDGRIVVEEPERIVSEVELFVDYLSLSDGLVASRGAVMLVGGALRELGGEAVVVNRGVELDVDPCAAARMFQLNLRSWREDRWIREQRTPAELDAMDTELGTYVSGERTGGIRWTIRQLVLIARPGLDDDDA